MTIITSTRIVGSWGPTVVLVRFDQSIHPRAIVILSRAILTNTRIKQGLLTSLIFTSYVVRSLIIFILVLVGSKCIFMLTVGIKVSAMQLLTSVERGGNSPVCFNHSMFVIDYCMSKGL